MFEAYPGVRNESIMHVSLSHIYLPRYVTMLGMVNGKCETLQEG